VAYKNKLFQCIKFIREWKRSNDGPRLRNSEPGLPDPIPFSENAPLRERLYPFRDELSLGADSYERRREIAANHKILVERLVMSESRQPRTMLRMPAVYRLNDPQHCLFQYIKRVLSVVSC
jgi:hypothetical protein